MKYKITIVRLIREEHEITLEGETIMSAFDEARRLADVRNKTITNGKYYVTKIKEDKDNE